MFNSIQIESQIHKVIAEGIRSKNIGAGIRTTVHTNRAVIITLDNGQKFEIKASEVPYQSN